MPAEGELLAGIGLENEGNDFQLPAGARVHRVLVELEVKRERVAASGVFDERRVIDIAAGDAAGIVGEQLVEVDLGDAPIRGGGRLFHGDGETGALSAVGGFDVGEIADSVLALEHGAQGLGGAHAVFPFLEQNAKTRDLGVGNRGGIDKIARGFEILPENRLKKGVRHVERVGEFLLGNRRAGHGRQGNFLDRPFAAVSPEIEEDAVAAGFLANQFERPAGAGVQFEFADLADAARLAEPERGGREIFEPRRGLRVEGVLADEPTK